LTRVLAEMCESVLAVEADPRLVNVLREELKDLANIRVIEDDVLRVRLLNFNRVVSVPPYHISSPLVSWLFDKSFDCGVLVFQKEFANRLVASVGMEGYGWLAVVAYYYFKVELLNDVPSWMFYPQPEVDSVIVRLKPKKPRPFNLESEDVFKRMTQSLFTHRNRKVRNAVLLFVKGEHATAGKNDLVALPFRDKRARELTPEDFGALANALVE
jgi:16S rRNA (adenine1518-N6/adenine1519-N6)-dimethyltransferase